MAVASTTAAVISAAVALAGTAAGAYGAVRQAESARQQQEYQAKLANRQARSKTHSNRRRPPGRAAGMATRPPCRNDRRLPASSGSSAPQPGFPARR